MPSRRFTLPTALLSATLLPAILLACAGFARPAAADPAAPLPHPSNLRSDILYTHKGEFVQVSPMRPLTLSAHVEQFAYDPLGLEIAYVGSEPQGENTLHFVKTVDVRTGKEISRLTLTAPPEDKLSGFLLHGFSVSGKYLLLQRSAPDPNHAETVVNKYLRWDLSADPPSTRTIDPEAALPPAEQSVDLEGSADCYPSPNGRWLVFTQSIHTQTDEGKPGPDRNAYLLYDPERSTFRLLTLPPTTVFAFWAGNDHLRLWQGAARKRMDVVTGEVSPLSANADAAKPAASRQYPDLLLDAEARDIDDLGSGGAVAPAYVVWIRRTSFGRLPLGAAAAGVMPSRSQVNNPYTNDPQAVWSPTGKQVAFVANGDLCVTNLIGATDLLPREKMAVGLKLSCDEERQLAISNLKQIGLALIQYAQDFDEHYPPTENIEQTLYPYLKTHDVFSVGSTHWVYHGISNASLASIDSPADTVQATMDLPCARLVLYFDGHVKSFPKQP